MKTKFKVGDLVLVKYIPGVSNMSTFMKYGPNKKIRIISEVNIRNHNNRNYVTYNLENSEFTYDDKSLIKI